MKNKTISLLLSCIICSCISCQSEKDQKGQEITLTNTSPVELTDKAIAIQRKELSNIPEGDFYPLITNQTGDTIPAQLDDLDGDNKWDALFFVADLPANGEATLSLAWTNTQPKFEKRTSVRFGVRSSKNTTVQPATSDTFYADELPWIMGYQPYQTDGPTWENDKVGFRHYFDGRNVKDVFGKKVAYMSPEDVGISKEGAAEDNYHVMQEWGRDILAAGNSVGIGGIALMIGDSLARLGITIEDTVNNVDSTTFRILTEGPVRSVIDLQYYNWTPLSSDRHYFVEETPSIWPGMYAYKNSVHFSGLQGDETLLVGLVNSNTKDPLAVIDVNDKWVILLTHDKQTYDKVWWLGLALILPKEQYLGYLEAPKTGSLSNTFLAKLKVENEKPVNYFAVAGWEISDEGFKDPIYFQNYVKDLVNQLSAEVKVVVK